MNHTVFAFAPGHPSPDTHGLKPLPEPGHEGAALPDREWGLSAPQVAGIVVAIVAVSEVIGLVLS